MINKMLKISLVLVIVLKIIGINLSYGQSFNNDIESLKQELMRERIKTQILNERYNQESLRIKAENEKTREIMNRNARDAQRNQVHYRNIMNNINAVHSTTNSVTNIIRQIQNLR